MRLDQMSWEEVAAYLSRHDDAILPVGSTEQHGPIGLIGTDALCATAVAEGVGARTGAIVLPPVPYTPAPFNMGFPGTISVSEASFAALVGDIVTALATHGFRRLYVLNGHGANLAPLRALAGDAPLAMRIRSWWDYPQTDARRLELYGDWEGMHATPSEIAITQPCIAGSSARRCLRPRRWMPPIAPPMPGTATAPRRNTARAFPVAGSGRGRNWPGPSTGPSCSRWRSPRRPRIS